MTIRQRDMLFYIANELATAKDHPSAKFRESVSAWSREQVVEVVHRIHGSLDAWDGFRAYRIIGAWHRDGLTGVMKEMTQASIVKPVTI